jgi:hypothetical protein
MSNPSAPGLSRRERRALRHQRKAIGHLAKLNVFTLAKRERAIETRTFREDGEEFTLTLRTPDLADLARAAEVAQQLEEDYLTGAAGRPPIPFPGDVKVSKALFLLAATAAEMQCPESAADRYEPEELVQLADKLPEAWAEAQEWIGAKQRAWEKRRGERPEPARDAGQSGAPAPSPAP